MPATTYEGAAILFSSLRIAPTLAFAPPFTLMRIPVTFRLLLALGLAAAITPTIAAPAPLRTSAEILAAIFHELMLGLLIAWVFQAAFAGLQVAGRTLDIQSGHALATVIDPTSRTMTPLTGQLFALAAGMCFFAADGHTALARVFAQSYWAAPFGTLSWRVPLSTILEIFAGFLAFSCSFGAAALIALFLTDCVVALLSRTAPQINPLLLGIQVKSVVLLAALFLTFSTATGLFNRFNALLLEHLFKIARG